MDINAVERRGNAIEYIISLKMGGNIPSYPWGSIEYNTV